MNIKQLQYVLVLSETQSFSKAAEELNISQPSLSQYIKKIEKEVGLDLFVRAGGNVRVTEAGKVYIEAGRKILDIEHQLQNQLADIEASKTGTIIVGISPYRSVHLMPQVVRRFHEKHPGIKLVLDERSGLELFEGANRGDFDIFVTTPSEKTTSFVTRHMLYEELILAVPKESELYFRLSKESRRVSDRLFPAIDINKINGEQFISLGEYMPMRLRTDELCSQYNLMFNTVLEVRSNEALISAVTSGVGAAIVPDCLSHYDEDNKRIAFFSFEQEIPRREVVLAYRHDQYLSKPINDLIEIMQDITL